MGSLNVFVICKHSYIYSIQLQDCFLVIPALGSLIEIAIHEYSLPQNIHYNKLYSHIHQFYIDYNYG